MSVRGSNGTFVDGNPGPSRGEVSRSAPGPGLNAVPPALRFSERMELLWKSDWSDVERRMREDSEAPKYVAPDRKVFLDKRFAARELLAKIEGEMATA